MCRKIYERYNKHKCFRFGHGSFEGRKMPGHQQNSDGCESVRLDARAARAASVEHAHKLYGAEALLDWRDREARDFALAMFARSSMQSSLQPSRGI